MALNLSFPSSCSSIMVDVSFLLLKVDVTTYSGANPPPMTSQRLLSPESSASSLLAHSNNIQTFYSDSLILKQTQPMVFYFTFPSKCHQLSCLLFIQSSWKFIYSNHTPFFVTPKTTFLRQPIASVAVKW